MVVLIIYGSNFMKKLLLSFLSVLLFAGIANSLDDINSIKEYVSDELNSTVSILKSYFKKTDTELKDKKIIVEDAKEKSKALKLLSLEKETNPVVLKQGLVEMPICDTETQELTWINDKWSCIVPSYGTDCHPASDEYRYEENGKFVCSKAAKGQLISYYYKYRGLGNTCGSDNKKPLVYSCYYKNKNNAEIEVSESYCEDKLKPASPNMDSIVIREPASGEFYEGAGWRHDNWGETHNLSGGKKMMSIQLSKSKVNIFLKNKRDVTSVNYNGWSYYRGSLKYRDREHDPSETNDHEYVYGFYRTKNIDPRAC
jgi:hypothetical protein